MPKMQPALRAYLTKLREYAFVEIRPGYIDSGAAPGKDTTWKDPEQFKPAVTTKAEAARKKKKLLWVVPRGKSKVAPPEEKPAEPKKPDTEPKKPDTEPRP